MQYSVISASTFFFCFRAVCATVIKFAAKTLPRSLWVPNDRFRHKTKARISRSAWLLVGSTFSISTKVQSAG